METGIIGKSSRLWACKECHLWQSTVYVSQLDREILIPFLDASARVLRLSFLSNCWYWLYPPARRSIRLACPPCESVHPPVVIDSTMHWWGKVVHSFGLHLSPCYKLSTPLNLQAIDPELSNVGLIPFLK